MKRYGKRIVSTAIEHPSVDETLNRLSSEGFEVIKLGVDSFGRIDENELFEAVTPDTILVSLMLVNNEIGTVMPVASAMFDSFVVKPDCGQKSGSGIGRGYIIKCEIQLSHLLPVMYIFRNVFLLSSNFYLCISGRTI